MASPIAIRQIKDRSDAKTNVMAGARPASMPWQRHSSVGDRPHLARRSAGKDRKRKGSGGLLRDVWRTRQHVRQCGQRRAAHRRMPSEHGGHIAFVAERVNADLRQVAIEREHRARHDRHADTGRRAGDDGVVEPSWITRPAVWPSRLHHCSKRVR